MDPREYWKRTVVRVHFNLVMRRDEAWVSRPRSLRVPASSLASSSYCLTSREQDRGGEEAPDGRAQPLSRRGGAPLSRARLRHRTPRQSHRVRIRPAHSRLSSARTGPSTSAQGAAAPLALGRASCGWPVDPSSTSST
eukprot:39813-Prorocentrum_minimum.AAC.1